MAIVSLAGPLSNLVLALIFSLLFKTLGVVSSEFLGQVVVYGVYINVGLGLFNLIPFPPLDGSRLLWAIAPDGLRDVMDRIESFGFAAIIFFMFVLFPFIQEPLNAANTFVLNLFF
jgi:Zn-dependent protease